ncbi:DNA repair metallo-beta-lactamase-domain-containing protein [Calycina marina]|uniref:DNA repair metallo-beta-lactamase-domain-containing protein n=1 Tax=Calycina marina TaxID=1763456 RepID=A0A9P7Z611_9HELO|nr:DNA repair metallo-beta-lactamase-domain-containing protein [Calycina marina]
MFRNPRENASPSIENPLKSSTGRPPTPPSSRSTTHQSLAAMTAIQGSTKPLTPRPNSKTNVPSTARQSVKKTPAIKNTNKPNASILKFFKKVDSPLKDDSIFFSQKTSENIQARPRQISPDVSDFGIDIEDLYEADENIDLKRYNELGGSVKRRRTSEGSTPGALGSDMEAAVTAKKNDMGKIAVSSSQYTGKIQVSGQVITEPSQKIKRKKSRQKGPFLADSDSDDEIYTPIQNGAPDAQDSRDAEKRERRSRQSVEYEIDTNIYVEDDTRESRSATQAVEPTKLAPRLPKKAPVADAQVLWEALQANNKVKAQEKIDVQPKTVLAEAVPLPSIPTLKQEHTSVDEWEKFDDLADQMDEFADGEEFIERKWMKDQAILDDADEGEHLDSFAGRDPADQAMAATCPICNAGLHGLSEEETTRHVNGCLDGNPMPLPEAAVPLRKSELSEVKCMPSGASRRFQKAAIARPGQANPFEFGNKTTAPPSAFSKLMAGHAEDEAWTTAAAAENASRGKAAYQRTCPFYKIMPGFFIAVDAFRYGAVQGINAYFLSHFHSDHYVGLTSSWCHGPIYCSKVTGNLVKQQLKVDSKWVVCLEFEDKIDVPGTNGVTVTMIPANHCPGSSLYLFEKVLGVGKTPKVQRVLHCGDFRACPAHIAHPKLMPDIVDSINGKSKQQKIDVCYLDTTYLNPRYAFPSQEDVITACAEMCVSLTKERAEEQDAWEVVKRQRAGTGMQKFVQNPSLKAEDSSEAMAIDNHKTRGRLLIVCGTYSIGKERICMGIARALDCKIYAPNRKLKICAALEDTELSSRMTDDPLEAQIHMQMIMELRPETLHEYLTTYKPHFSRIVGFRPSGWNYKPPNSRFTDSPTVSTVLNSLNWRSSYSIVDLVPQRGSTKEASCFGVPYSEHSSFRELSMFVCALRIEKVIPTVNVGNASSRAKMKSWIERWQAERRKNGVIKIGNGEGEVGW